MKRKIDREREGGGEIERERTVGVVEDTRMYGVDWLVCVFCDEWDCFDLLFFLLVKE